MKTNKIPAQVSLYPLRQSHLGPAISTVTEALRLSGLGVSPGTMRLTLQANGPIAA
jgi:hypothetical protein